MRRLNLAARSLASGAPLSEAIERAGYHALRSASIHIRGALTPRAVESLLGSRFCRLLTDPALRDIGLYRRRRELWIVAAEPFAAPALSHPARVRREVLRLVNQARSRARRCGAQEFAPARPLAPSSRLRRAALEHSRDMAAHDLFSHEGSDHSTPGERVTRTGYPWSAVGENIAAGQTTARQVVDAWLASPEHCANIMEPRFTHTGIAYVVAAASAAGVYWTEDFARPLRKRSRRR
ncbi:MAG: CAP domain-containing protein [Steroidobacteraceae bacterium]